MKNIFLPLHCFALTGKKIVFLHQLDKPGSSTLGLDGQFPATCRCVSASTPKSNDLDLSRNLEKLTSY